MEKKAHLPLIGVGPFYVFGIIVLTIIGMGLSISGVIKSGKARFLRIPFAVIGICLILIGIIFWLRAIFESKIDDNIKHNRLVTTGVYACVRNPIYSAFMMMCTGILLLNGNVWLLILPAFYWLFLTVLMKFTEEKWLMELYGQNYVQYCQRVNRCIPWFSKK